MARRFGRALLLGLVALAVAPVSSANAQVAPPWCGTPENDAAANLPDGSQPGQPVGSFPHIPYYAIKCTLEDIEARSDGRMEFKVIGRSALGREMFGVVINELETQQQRRDFRNWQDVRKYALKDPEKAQNLVRRYGDDLKVPVWVQGGIHGNEYEGVDASMDQIERLATTPYGEDPVVDEILDRAVIVFNPIQNPDGRVAGTRANGNGFDLNRDYLTQSQSETRASIGLMKEWLSPEMLDLHGYVTPTLIEATTKPHNPSIEYDLWLKWNQSRIDANEAALNAIGQQVTRPINDWCADGNPAPASGICPGGGPPGPGVAEGWDDWGPFYTAMYAQHVGMDSSTVEMCQSTTSCGGRAGARRIQNTVVDSTAQFVVDNREEMLDDMLEIYIRGDEDAERPACCPPPFDVDNNWMHDYPQAYVIPVGAGQRSDAEANRLVEWLLFNDIEVDVLQKDYRLNGQTFEKGSYVVWIAQPRRGLLDTALSIGTDLSARISILYAPPAAWSHGYLWGADVVTVEDGETFRPNTNGIDRPTKLKGGLESDKQAGGYVLEIDSPTAVRALNELVGAGVEASIALESFSGGAAGTVVFGTGKSNEKVLDDVAKKYGLEITPLGSGALPSLDPIERVPRIAVLTGAVDQQVWVLRELGFQADPVSTGTIGSAATDPLANYDVIFNVGSNWPGNTTARTRLSAFFATGGGYIGGQATGLNFIGPGTPQVAGSNQVPGLSVASDSGGGAGYSGILFWDNAGGEDSVITGVFPERDTLIADPPTWITGAASLSVDGRLPAAGFFGSGLWPNFGASGAAGAPIIAHGSTVGDSARVAVFANNPLYRADPEREWPMVGTAAYWADR
jgi:zinc carboxypeptidase